MKGETVQKMPMFQITINADTAEELVNAQIELASALRSGEGATAAPAAPANSEEPPKKRGRKPSAGDKLLAEHEAVKENPPPTPAPAPAPTPQAPPAPAATDLFGTVEPPPKPPAAKTATREEAAAALQRVMAKDGVGYDGAVKILTKFGCAKLSELKPEQYGPFVIECEQVFERG